MVASTIKFPNSGTSMTVTKSGSTLTIVVTDASITNTNMAGAVWTTSSKVKASGVINGVQTDTMDGTLTAINTTSHTITISVSGGNAASVAAGTYAAAAITNFSIMLYQRYADSTYYPVGILLNAYDSNNSSATIRIYGGSSALPNVMLGNLTSAGLGTVNNMTPTGWGLFAQNAFLHGTIVSSAGRIAGWTLDGSSFYTGTWGTENGVMMCTGTSSSKSIGGSASINGWTITSGAKFGVTKAGALYCSDIHASSGTIGNFTLSGGKLYSNNHSAWNTDATGVYMNSDGIAGGKKGIWYLWHDGSAKIGAMTLTAAGVLSVPAANITGTLKASQIGADAITVGGRNLVRGSRTMTIGAGSHVTGTFRASGSNATMANVTYAETESPVVGVTSGIKITTSTASGEYGFAQDGAKLKAGTITYSIWMKASEACTARIQPWWTNSSSAPDSFTETVSVTTSWKRYTVTGTLNHDHLTDGISISYIYLSNSKVGLVLYTCAPMMEYGNFPSDWTTSPDEAAGFAVDANKIHSGTIGSDNSVYLSTANMTANIAGRGSTADWRFTVGSHFGVTNTGAVYCNSATITGAITATSGYIGGTGGFYITTNKMYSNNHSAYNTAVAGVYIGTDYISLGSGGVTYFKNDGTGKIGKWIITTTSIYKGNATMGTAGTGNMYFGDSGLSISNTFKVSSAGALTATGVNITGTVNATTVDVKEKIKLYLANVSKSIPIIQVRSDSTYVPNSDWSAIQIGSLFTGNNPNYIEFTYSTNDNVIHNDIKVSSDYVTVETRHGIDISAINDDEGYAENFFFNMSPVMYYDDMIYDKSLATPSAKNVASGSNVNLCSFKLTPGLYIVEAMAHFDSNTSGRRKIMISDSSTGSQFDRFSRTVNDGVSGEATPLKLFWITESYDTKTWYLVGYQNSGSTLSCTYGVRTIRLKNYNRI